MKSSNVVTAIACLVTAGCSGLAGSIPQDANSAVLGPRQMISTTVVGTRGLAVGDIDGDGYVDVLATSEYEGEVYWFRNRNGAGFAQGIVVTNAFESALTVNVADLNADGILDVVVGGDERIEWYENLGAGRFAPGRVVSGGLPKIIRVSVSDLDGDGDADLIGASKFKVSWFENRGSGAFAPAFVVNTDVKHVNWSDAADFNNDARPDIFAISYEHEFPEIREDPGLAARVNKEDTLVWHANSGNGRFGPAQKVGGGIGIIQSHTRAGDIDGDGRADLVSCHLQADQIVWYKNRPDGTFAASQVITSKIDGPEAVILADLDLDNDIDVVSAALFDGMFRLHSNRGDGSFDEAVVLARNVTDPIAIEVADIDRDGDLDVIAAAEREGTVFWFENKTRRPGS